MQSPNRTEIIEACRIEALHLLRAWAVASERHWLDLSAEQGCYGTGYNNWGVQTNQKYVTALAALATCSDDEAQSLGIDRDWATARALAAFRFSLNSYVTATGRCTDGSKWGCTWISALGIERMMAGVAALDHRLNRHDRKALRSMLVSEADYLLNDYSHGGHRGIRAGLWGDSGHNHPESNQWNGALLWRTAQYYPDHPHAVLWQQRAHEFLVNAVSLQSDAYAETVIGGKPVHEWHIGGNFFPAFALDHHGYFNVGYMVICVSGAAMLYHDLKSSGHQIPDSLFWHVGELWRVLRRFIFSDGRLARVGGDSRVRYAYCQEYLIPSLLLATEVFGERSGSEIISGFLRTIRREFDFNGDGSFYGSRLSELAATNPYYYTRLESDRACALGLLCLYAPRIEWPATTLPFEPSVSGSWLEPEYGAALHRSKHRFASFAWRAFGLAQGLCLPPDEGDMAEWEGNLTPVVRFMGDDGSISGGQRKRRRLISQKTESFEGGFLTCGLIEEGIDLTVDEGCTVSELAHTSIVFCALPDGHTVIGLHYCRSLDKRAFLLEMKGLHLCVPNDLLNGGRRTVKTGEATHQLESPPSEDEIRSLESLWANIDDKIGVVALFGCTELKVHRTKQRRAGKFKSLFIEELCIGCEFGARPVAPDTVLLDCAWAVLSGVDARQTAEFAAANPESSLDLPEGCRGVQVRGLDGRLYGLAANFGERRECVRELNRYLEPYEAGLLTLQ